MDRPTWDTTWMEMATAMSRRSRCVNRQVGCVIVTPQNRPMAVGYNGPPANFDTSPVIHFGVPSVPKSEKCDDWCERGGSNDRGTSYSNCVSVHAEANALLFADRRDYEGGTIYITNFPCWDCAKLVANSGIRKVVTLKTSEDDHVDKTPMYDLLKSCGLEIVFI